LARRRVPLCTRAPVQLMRWRSSQPFFWSRNGWSGGSQRSRSPTAASSTRQVWSGGKLTKWAWTRSRAFRSIKRSSGACSTTAPW